MFKFFVFFVSLIVFSSAIGAAPDFVSKGAVDSVSITSDTNELVITAVGWAGAGNPASRITNLIIKLDTEIIYNGHFKRINRPDVVRATGREDWGKSGWAVNAVIPGSLNQYEYDLKIQAVTDNGDRVNLEFVNNQFKKVQIKQNFKRKLGNIFAGFVAILLVPLFYVAFVHGQYLVDIVLRYTGKSVAPAAIVAGLIGLLFLLLVCAGITGSSVKLLYDQSPFLKVNSANIAFSSRPIRSDEWLVVTPMAIGQFNASPAFPIVNPNLGIEGQNMLVVGMTGVPVKHLTQLAKPSTWGFFLFDLNKALAWYWWFPTFSCLLALWGVFNLLIPGRWQLGFFLSLLFCLSPYPVAWSNWPAYAVFFPSLAFWSIIHLLRQTKWWLTIVLAILLGLSMSGFVLLLYPPWQVTLGSLYLFIAMGLVCRDHRHLYFDRGKIFALLVASMIVVVILGVWWNDANVAINAMRNTVYPGQREIMGGGGSILYLLRGFTNIGSLYKLETGYSNQSEIASFYYYFVPLIVALGFRIKQSRESIYLIFPIALFLAFTFIYAMHGVPHFVAVLTQWSRVPSARVDLALGLSQIFLYGLVFAGGVSHEKNSEKRIIFAGMVSFLWTVLVVYVLSALPKGVFIGITDAVLFALILTVFLSGVWLILRDTKKFMSINLALCAVTTLAFNPLSFAIEKIDINEKIKVFLGSDLHSIQKHKRVLVLQSHVPAMALLSAGLPTVNGILYYPQFKLWQHLGVNEKLSDVINRYQHLIFVAGKVDVDEGFLIESPHADIVKVTIDAMRFDFTKTDAEQLTAPTNISERLKQNVSLHYNGSYDGWSWFDVIAKN